MASEDLGLYSSPSYTSGYSSKTSGRLPKILSALAGTACKGSSLSMSGKYRRGGRIQPPTREGLPWI